MEQPPGYMIEGESDEVCFVHRGLMVLNRVCMHGLPSSLNLSTSKGFLHARWTPLSF